MVNFNSPSLELAIGMPQQSLMQVSENELEPWLLRPRAHEAIIDGWYAEDEAPLNFMFEDHSSSEATLRMNSNPACWDMVQVKKEHCEFDVQILQEFDELAQRSRGSSFYAHENYSNKLPRLEEFARQSQHGSPCLTSLQIRQQIKSYADKLLEASSSITESSNNNVSKGEFESPAELHNQGVRLVQLLLSCAEAVACRDVREAASFLKQLQGSVSPYGNAMQRVGACFVEGLVARLEILNSPHLKPQVGRNKSVTSESEKQEAFHLVYAFCPYISFGHFVANSAILEAIEGENRVHIVDLGMSTSLQWPFFIQRLAARHGGPPQLLRITSVGVNPNSSSKVREAEQELMQVAKALNVPFQFRVLKESIESIQPRALDLRRGEALVINSISQLHCVVKESRGSLNTVLQSLHRISPKIITLVEQDGCHNGPFFLGRFMEALHYYSAVFDSFDKILPRYSTQRVKMEQFYFAEEIKNIVSCEGPTRVERHEKLEQWRRRMGRAGFQPRPLKLLNGAKNWLQHFFPCEGYTLAEEKGCLVLGWKGKGIVAASSWKC